MPKVSFERGNVDDALACLADIAKQAERKDAAICTLACQAVASLIVGCGQYGGTAQVKMMRAAEAAGFKPEFYPGSVRVHWIAAEIESTPTRDAMIKHLREHADIEDLVRAMNYACTCAPQVDLIVEALDAFGTEVDHWAELAERLDLDLDTLLDQLEQ